MQAGKPRQQESWQRGWWLVITIHALLLPLYGPLVDHHFAERLPYHTHLYLAAEPDHQHLHNVPHNHDHETENLAPVSQTAATISIPAHELANQNLLLLSLFLAALTIGVGQPSVILHFLGLAERGLRPATAIFLPCPEEPPRPLRQRYRLPAPATILPRFLAYHP